MAVSSTWKMAPRERLYLFFLTKLDPGNGGPPLCERAHSFTGTRGVFCSRAKHVLCHNTAAKQPAHSLKVASCFGMN